MLLPRPTDTIAVCHAKDLQTERTERFENTSSMAKIEHINCDGRNDVKRDVKGYVSETQPVAQTLTITERWPCWLAHPLLSHQGKHESFPEQKQQRADRAAKAQARVQLNTPIVATRNSLLNVS
ncbi:hypothetical protein RRG08_047726 [Elysia crispata]|uniref:Uncharacterized protein n=1 Tax=Elysia crispata TaxID=231223 RepID=A0AAE1DU85_9GAST|nr:hypothetical protein RRG08_047726 [Elysia crispata]